MQLKPHVTLFTGIPGSGKTYHLKEIAKKKSPDMPVFVYGRASEWNNIKSIQLHSLPGAEYNSGYADWNSEISKMKIPGQKVLIVDGVSCASMIQICNLTDESFDIYFSLQDMSNDKFDFFIRNHVDSLFIGKIAGENVGSVESIIEDKAMTTKLAAYINQVPFSFAEVTEATIKIGNTCIERKRKPLLNNIKGKYVLVILETVIAICMTLLAASYVGTVISYFKTCTLDSRNVLMAMTGLAVVLIVYFGFIIMSGKYIRALLQKSEGYEIIYHRIGNRVAVEECEIFYYGNPVHCTWKREKGHGKISADDTDRATLLNVIGEGITKKNHNAVKMYVSEWAQNMQNS